MSMHTVAQKRLVSAGIRRGSIVGTPEDLIESRLVQAESALTALQAASRTHRDLSLDARIWLADLDEQIEAMLGTLDEMRCAACSQLGIWLHPDTLDRYCRAHQFDFIQCEGRCRRYVALDQTYGEPPACQACDDERRGA